MSREPSQMQTDDENMPQITGSRILKSSTNENPQRSRTSLARARSALTDLNNNSTVTAPASMPNAKARLSLPPQQSSSNVANNVTTTTSTKIPQIMNHQNKQVKIRADEQQVLLQQQQQQNDETPESERTEEQKQDENRRMSLKRQITDSSTDDLLDQKATQDLKKAKIEDEHTWDDLDADDIDDPLMVSEYVDDIFQYLHELEIKTLPDANYLHWQRNLRPKMRSILVDWMVEVHLKFRLLPETLYLAINLMDRFMSKESVQVDRLQLLATGSLFIAAKYEEVYSPSVKNYAYVTDGGFTEDEILNAEKFILEILDFNMSYPNPMNFLRRISKADDYDVQSRTVGKYLLEISIIDHKFIGYLPSLCSAAAMYISRKMLAKFEWNGNLIHYSGGYKESDLKEVSEMIIDYLISPIIHEEFFKKYASRKFMKVSILARQWAKKITGEGKNIMDPVL